MTVISIQLKVEEFVLSLYLSKWFFGIETFILEDLKSVLLGKGKSGIKAKETELDLYSTFPPPAKCWV